jgi:hypothetical protein
MRASQKYSRASFTEIFILWMGPICNRKGLIYKWAAPSSCRKRLLLWKETSEKTYKGQIGSSIVEPCSNVTWLLPLVVKRDLLLWKETSNGYKGRIELWIVESREHVL